MTAGSVAHFEQIAGFNAQGVAEGFNPIGREVVEPAGVADEAIDPGGVQATTYKPAVHGSCPRLADEAVGSPAAGGQQFGEHQTHGHAQCYPQWALLTIVGCSATIEAGYA